MEWKVVLCLGVAFAVSGSFESELHQIKKEADKIGLTLTLTKNTGLTKREAATANKDDVTPKSTTAKSVDVQPKYKKKKKVGTPEPTKKDKILKKEMTDDVVKQDGINMGVITDLKHEDNIEENPKVPSESKGVNEGVVDEKSNFKRVAKDDVEDGEAKPIRTLVNPLKKFRKSKTSEPVVGAILPKDKILKPSIASRKAQVTACSGTSARIPLEAAKERILRLIDRTHLPKFNCASINTEVESIRSLLQQASHKSADFTHRETDRAKILEQIRTREKKRQARMQSRFGHLDVPKPKHKHLVGGFRATEKTSVVNEPHNLMDE